MYYPILNTSGEVTKWMPGNYPESSCQIEKYVFKNTSYMCLTGVLAKLWPKLGETTQICYLLYGDFCPGWRFGGRGFISLKCIKRERGCLKLFLPLSAWKGKHMKWGKKETFHSVIDFLKFTKHSSLYLIPTTFLPARLVHKSPLWPKEWCHKLCMEVIWLTFVSFSRWWFSYSLICNWHTVIRVVC